jgi:mono/diheme cytochrome c family protein
MRGSSIQQAIFGLIAAAALVPGAASAEGSNNLDAKAGKTLARQWCAECHVVEAGQGDTLSTAAPTFFDVAANAATTEMSLRAFFVTPHDQMPDIQLTNEQTDDIIAYILSLRAP